MKIPSAVRYFNKHILNRVTRYLGYARFGRFAMIRHVGRRSGKPYETPIIVQPIDGGFVIALTYGKEVDWYRNVLAAGRCEIYWHRQTFPLTKIEPIDTPTGQNAFPQPERTILKLVGIPDYVTMKA